MLKLSFPKKQSISFSNAILKLFNQAIRTKEEEILFDLSRSEVITPFSTVILSALISECLRRGKKCKYKKPEKKSLQRFLREIGFDGFFGLGEKPPSIKTDKVQLQRVDGIDYQLVEQVIMVFAYHLNLSPGVKGSLQMSIQETMTNVVDHSGTKEYYVCAQAYPRNRKIRLCIVDLGIGILDSLKALDEYKNLKNDYMAIEKATLSGVSCRPGRAGLGLNHIKQFINVNKGQMCIISGRGKVFWRDYPLEPIHQTMSVPFDGTIVKLLINIDKSGYYMLKNELEDLF